MNEAKITPKDFFLWAGAMVALYWSVVAFILLFFNYIDYTFPDPLAYLSDPYSSGIPYEMSSIAVLFPTFIALMWLIRRDIAADATRRDIWVRRWAIIFTLFVAGLAAVIDLITLLTAFFRGETITEAFLLKVLIVFFVAAVAFMHFIADFWGYWQLFPQRNRSVLYGVSVLAFVSVFGGFLVVGTPQQARLYRFDDQKVNDLQMIQSEIITYWQGKQALPANLSDLNNALSGFTVPADPQSAGAYEYRVNSKTGFELCAAFNAPTQAYSLSGRSVPMPAPYGMASQGDAWVHGAGRSCFARTIDPALYPPLKK